MNTTTSFSIVADKTPPTKDDFITRSITINKSIQKRIDNLAAANWQYSKKAIVNQLLSDALEMYGY